jgi:hypothetical protein
VTAGLRLDSLSVARLGSVVVRDVSLTVEPGRPAGDHTGTERSGQYHTQGSRHGSPPRQAPCTGPTSDPVTVTTEAIDA